MTKAERKTMIEAAITAYEDALGLRRYPAMKAALAVAEPLIRADERKECAEIAEAKAIEYENDARAERSSKWACANRVCAARRIADAIEARHD